MYFETTKHRQSSVLPHLSRWACPADPASHHTDWNHSCAARSLDIVDPVRHFSVGKNLPHRIPGFISALLSTNSRPDSDIGAGSLDFFRCVDPKGLMSLSLCLARVGNFIRSVVFDERQQIPKVSFAENLQENRVVGHRHIPRPGKKYEFLIVSELRKIRRQIMAARSESDRRSPTSDRRWVP